MYTMYIDSVSNCVYYNFFFILAVPVITQNLQRTLSVTNGKDFSLSCIAECKPPSPDYQWYFNNDPLPNETAPTLSISNCNASHTGIYHCVVSNPCIADNDQSRVATGPCRVEILNVPIQGERERKRWLDEFTLYGIFLFYGQYII